MRIAVTGANGFLGRAVVRAALARGWQVQVLLREGRSTQGWPWSGHVAASTLAIGLHDSPELVDALRGCDAVLHLAAALSGNETQQLADTVASTDSFLHALRSAGVRRLVGVSSFALYDYTALPAGSSLSEASPIQLQPGERSVYARAKLLQERAFQAYGSQGREVAILRPAVIYDADTLWNFTLGRGLGSNLWLAMGPDAALPLVHVDDVAEALLLAAERPEAVGAIINLVEDQPPHRYALLAALNQASVKPRRVLRFPWSLHRLLAQCVGGLARAVGVKRIPGLLDPVELAVRFKPLRYDNRLAHRLLGWQPRHRAMDVAAKRNPAS